MAALIAVAAIAWFGHDLASEPPFVDESAYLSQSYFADLWLGNQADHPAWLDYPAYDLPPLPKYLFGLALMLEGDPRPGPTAARAWYEDTSRRFGSPASLLAARRIAVLFGALGCVAVFGLGCLVQDRRVGILAAVFLTLNPLYRLHARRAMSDVIAESLILLASLAALWTWRRILDGKLGPAAWVATVLAGFAAGLAALAKLNGALAMIIVGVWAALAVVLPRVPARAKVAIPLAAVLAGLVSLATFVALNPFLTAQPHHALPPESSAIAALSLPQRLRFLIDHRVAISGQQQVLFAHNALATPTEKLKAIVVQGFGRFGPLGPRHSDSTRRYDAAQDLGALIWIPSVVLGALAFLDRGRRQRIVGEPPTAWAVLLQVLISLIVVTAYLPLAWDRYFLSLQAGAALLAAGAVVAAADALRGTVAADPRGGGLNVRALRGPEAWVFAILLASYACFWHARDWNSASRLMLTFAIVDRGTIVLDGLDDQTGDKARFRGHYYTDKVPGYSLLAVAPYALAKTALGFPPHPLGRRGFAYWPADYWATLGTSGLLSALTGGILVALARDLGCGPRRAALVGLAYGLATPAYAYATLSYGHQASAFALLAATALLWRLDGRHAVLRMVLAGFLASYAAIIELQVGLVAAVLTVYLVAQVAGRRRTPSAIGDFAVGALIPALLLLGYNQLAFGSPWDMGYFHLVTPMFRTVHSTDNPLGLRLPDATVARALLWGRYRGVTFYAPILLLAVPGWIALAARRFWGLALVSAAATVAIFVVNLSYPEWSGGWTTGPRLLVPLLPFAMLPVAALLAVGGRGTISAAVFLALGGGVLTLLFQGVGARIPQFVADPLRDAVWPLWRGDPLPPWSSNGRFARNLVSLAFPGPVQRLPERWGWVQFLPIAAAQLLAIAALAWHYRSFQHPRGPVRRSGDERAGQTAP